MTDSSDDDYGGVDQISDSEDDEPDVRAAEEQAIIESEDDQATPRPLYDDQYEGFLFDNQPEILQQPMSFFMDHLAALAAAQLANNGSQSASEEERGTRHVRFDLSESETAEEDDSFFPDIFLPQDEMDPSFRRTIDQEDGDGMLSDGSWERYDAYELPEDLVEKAIAENEDTSNEDSDSDESEDGSSGYDSDESGYTTDDEIPTPAAPPRAFDRRASQISSSSEEEIQRTPARRGPKLPQLHTWKIGNNKTFMIFQKAGEKIIVFNRHASRRASVDGATSTPAQTPSRNNSIVEASPMISNSGNIMMSAMADFANPFGEMNMNGWDGSWIGGQALGPPEAFYPFTSINADGTLVQDSSSAYDEDDLDDEEILDVTDFITFGDDDTDDENNEVEQSSDADATSTPAPSSTPARPTTARSEDQVHPLLDHFDKGVVGSFRRNQNQHQLLTRNSASRDSLAFGGTHLEGTIRGVKSGRLHHANTPITPARKAKTLKPIVPSSPASPLAQLNKKRKYDGEEFNGHKRNKSLI